MEFINRYVAPWVLSKQAVPIHCVWVPEKNLKKVEITIPKGYTLSDTLNFTEYEHDGTKNIIYISIDALKSDNYLGIVLTYPNIIENIEQRDEVKVRFLDKENALLSEQVFQTRIVRPKLEFLNFPKEILVTDETNPKNLLNLEILHKGFGTANLNISVSHSGINISKTDSIYFDVVKNVLEKIASSAAFTATFTEDTKPHEDFQIDEDILRKTAEELLKETSQRELPFDISSEALNEVVEILKDETKREIVDRIVFSSLKSILVAALLYYSERHPEEDIKLLYGKIAAVIKERIDELSIKISYYDSLWNVYPPIEAKIRVLDMRNIEGAQSEFEVPINISWKRDILKLEE